MGTIAAIATGLVIAAALVAASITIAIISDRRRKRRGLPRRPAVEDVQNDASRSGSLGVYNLPHDSGMH